jgi:stage V sporulation protein B
MKFVKSIFTSFLSNMFGLFVSFMTIIVTARILGPNGNGVYNLAMVFIGFAGILFGFGIQASNVYFIGENRKNINNVLGINFVVMAIALVGNLILFLLNLHFHFAFLRGLVGVTLFLVLMTVPLYILKTSLYYVLLGIEEVTKYNTIMMVDKAVTFLFLVVVLIITRSPEMTIVSNLAATVVMVLTIMYILFVKKGYRISLNRNITRGMFSYGFKSQLGNAIQSINYRLDVFVTAAYLTSTAVGLYTKASNLG